MSRKRRPWHRRLLRGLGPALGIRLGPGLLRALAATWRVRLVGREHWDDALAAGRPPVFALWHQDIPAGVLVHRRDEVAVLISRHRDGELVARIVERFGHRTARGSSFEGGRAGLRAMLREAREPRPLVITPDGPRGPARQVAPGVLFLAAATGRPLLATGFAASRAWRARSWDRMVIPKPFARVVVVYDRGLDLPRAARREGPAREEATRLLQERLAAAEERARRVLAGEEDT